MSLTLFTYGSSWEVPDISPFCTKLHTYLRMAEVPYERGVGNPQQAPKGKLPYIKYNDELYADTHFIIKFLEKELSLSFGSDLTPEQKAISTAFQGMLEESFYFTAVYSRWVPTEAWKLYGPVLKGVLREAGAPGFLTHLIVPMIRRGVRKMLMAQGMGRHTKQEVVAIATPQLDSISHYLGSKTFFFGNKPSPIDATVFAMLSAFRGSPIASPIKTHLESLPNLCQYHDHILQTYYPEITG